MTDLPALLAAEPDGQLTQGDAALIIRLRDAVRELAKERDDSRAAFAILRSQLSDARLASKALGDRIMEFSFDPESASKAFAVGVALRRLEDAIAPQPEGKESAGD